LFTLPGFGRLRCPSEHLALAWPDVDWEREWLRVVSSKKEHLEGEGMRLVPIFPELRPYLEEVFELATEGAVHVINRYRDGNQNLRTQLQRIIRRAGLEAWPKLFHNLRASRETEMATVYPMHVACAWIGNTERIAAKHYLQVTEDYFTLAAKRTAQNTAHSSPKQPKMQGSTEHAPNEKTPDLPGFSADSQVFSEAGQYPHGDSNPGLLAENQTS